ncbi:MAG: hypothetical protein WCT41_03280 [Candidatus Paceibacterota bacterium]|jgi:hypothetical protein
MKRYIFGAILFIGVVILPTCTQAAGLTADQATMLINVVKASPSTPASAFVDLITAFSGVTVNQATALITVVQSSPATSAEAFIPLLTSFTSDRPLITVTQPVSCPQLIPPQCTGGTLLYTGKDSNGCITGYTCSPLKTNYTCADGKTVTYASQCPVAP